MLHHMPVIDLFQARLGIAISVCFPCLDDTSLLPIDLFPYSIIYIYDVLRQLPSLDGLFVFPLSLGRRSSNSGSLFGLPLIRWLLSLQSQWPGVGVLALLFALALPSSLVAACSFWPYKAHKWQFFTDNGNEFYYLIDRYVYHTTQTSNMPICLMYQPSPGTRSKTRTTKRH